jgi:hypothetical protein
VEAKDLREIISGSSDEKKTTAGPSTLRCALHSG